LKGNYDLGFPEEKLGQSQKPYVAGGGGKWIFSGTYMLPLQYQLVKETLLIRSNSICFNEPECNQKSFENEFTSYLPPNPWQSELIMQ